MYRFRLSSNQVQLDLVANGLADRLPFQVIGPTTEVAFLEELIEEHFGSLSVNPGQLFNFLRDDPWVQESFPKPQLIEGELNSQVAEGASRFASQTLGNKLVQAGLLDLEELDQLLEDYRPFAETQRFGEFLRLNMQVPPQMLELLLNPELLDQQGFNEQRLGERLLTMGTVTNDQLHEALEEQSQTGKRLGEILAEKGWITSAMARFFSMAKVNQDGEIEYTAVEDQTS